jgi:hypothetical protein
MDFMDLCMDFIDDFFVRAGADAAAAAVRFMIKR